MKRFFTGSMIAIAIIILFGMCLNATAQEITDLNFLRQGGHTLVFRHTSAPGGDPTTGGTGNDTGGSLDSLWWMQCDTRKSRQLSTQGRVEALTIGLTMKRLGIRVSTTVSSEFCRCYETAVLMSTGVHIGLLPGLTMTVYSEDVRKRGMDSLVRLFPVVNSTNTVIVTHGIPFSDTLYNRIQTLAWGDAAIYRPQVNGQPQFVGFVRVGVWAGAKPTAVQEDTPHTLSAMELSIAPNPAFDRLYVRSDEPVRVTMINALGQVVWSDERMAPTKQIPIEGLAMGSYTVIVSNSKRTVSRTFVKLP
jgi:hypothetical protein